MPQVFKIGSYIVYFWVNENDPLEPVHVHVAQGVPTENGTKIWITQKGKALLCHNSSKIPSVKLHYIMDIVEARSSYICNKWLDIFGQISYYC